MKISISDMQTLARDRGGECLSTQYVNNATKLAWQCKEGHKWETTPNHIKQGHWCPACAGSHKRTLEEMQQIARSRGGRCLSEEYTNSRSKLTWQCKDGHQWKAVPSNIKLGQWCPVCAGTQLGTIEEMRTIAKSRGGKCLSEEYTNSRTKLAWQCKEGHQWKALPSSIKQGHWCLVCAGSQKATIEDMQELAKKKGGYCLSEAYVNNYSKIKWQCKEGHQWEAVPGSIVRGFWCPICASNARKATIEEMQQIAEAHEGKCVSREYITTHSKLIWQCKAGHRWENTPSHIKQGIWCPVCTDPRRGTLEEMRKIAEGRGGKCLSMEYINSQTKLTWQCRDGHLWEATPAHVKQGHWCPGCASLRIGTIKEMRQIAASRDGQCLSAEYVNSHTKLTWKCKEGHQWNALPRNIKQGHWCPRCARIKK